MSPTLRPVDRSATGGFFVPLGWTPSLHGLRRGARPSLVHVVRPLRRYDEPVRLLGGVRVGRTACGLVRPSQRQVVAVKPIDAEQQLYSTIAGRPRDQIHAIPLPSQGFHRPSPVRLALAVLQVVSGKAEMEHVFPDGTLNVSIRPTETSYSRTIQPKFLRHPSSI